MITLEEKLNQYQKYLNSLNDSGKLIEKHQSILWYAIHYKAFSVMGIKPEKHRLNFDKNSKNASFSADKLGKAAWKSGFNVTKDIVIGSEPDLSKEAFKIGVRGIAWLAEFAEDSLTSAEQFYSQAVEQFKSKHYQDSFNSVNKAIRKNKKYADAFCLRGYIYAEVGELKSAIQDLNSAIEVNSSCVNAYKKRASINYANANYKKALEDECFLISHQLHDSTSYFRIGMSYANLRQAEKALESFNISIQANPSHILSYLARGFVLLASGKNLSQAVKDFKYAIKMDANCAEAYLGCAKAYETLGQYSCSVDCYSTVIKHPKICSRNIWLSAYGGRCLSHFSYALSLASKGSHKEAAEQFTHCNKDYQSSNLRNKKFHAEIIRNRCLSYVSSGKKWKARSDAHFERLNPKDIQGLDLTNLEKFSVATLMICLLPMIFFCIREIPNLNVFPSFERWSNQQLFNE